MVNQDTQHVPFAKVTVMDSKLKRVFPGCHSRTRCWINFQELIVTAHNRRFTVRNYHAFSSGGAAFLAGPFVTVCNADACLIVVFVLVVCTAVVMA